MRFCRTAWNRAISASSFSFLRVHEITEQMKFGVVVFGGEFRAGNEFDARRRARRRHARATLDRIVVRQRQRREAEPLAVPGQFLRRKRAVGKMRVQMEVGEFHLTILAGRINSPFTLSRMPLTNLPLSCVENFLAMSTASLMLTTGGMSSRIQHFVNRQPHDVAVHRGDAMEFPVLRVLP